MSFALVSFPFRAQAQLNCAGVESTSLIIDYSSILTLAGCLKSECGTRNEPYVQEGSGSLTLCDFAFLNGGRRSSGYDWRGHIAHRTDAYSLMASSWHLRWLCMWPYYEGSGEMNSYKVACGNIPRTTEMSKLARGCPLTFGGNSSMRN
jgi:hypothetical protein